MQNWSFLFETFIQFIRVIFGPADAPFVAGVDERGDGWSRTIRDRPSRIYLCKLIFIIVILAVPFYRLFVNVATRHQGRPESGIRNRACHLESPAALMALAFVYEHANEMRKNRTVPLEDLCEKVVG